MALARGKKKQGERDRINFSLNVCSRHLTCKSALVLHVSRSNLCADIRYHYTVLFSFFISLRFCLRINLRRFRTNDSIAKAHTKIHVQSKSHNPLAAFSSRKPQTPNPFSKERESTGARSEIISCRYLTLFLHPPLRFFSLCLFGSASCVCIYALHKQASSLLWVQMRRIPTLACTLVYYGDFFFFWVALFIRDGCSLRLFIVRLIAAARAYLLELLIFTELFFFFF